MQTVNAESFQPTIQIVAGHADRLTQRNNHSKLFTSRAHAAIIFVVADRFRF